MLTANAITLMSRYGEVTRHVFAHNGRVRLGLAIDGGVHALQDGGREVIVIGRNPLEPGSIDAKVLDVRLAFVDVTAGVPAIRSRGFDTVAKAIAAALSRARHFSRGPKDSTDERKFTIQDIYNATRSGRVDRHLMVLIGFTPVYVSGAESAQMLALADGVLERGDPSALFDWLEEGGHFDRPRTRPLFS